MPSAPIIGLPPYHTGHQRQEGLGAFAIQVRDDLAIAFYSAFGASARWTDPTPMPSCFAIFAMLSPSAAKASISAARALAGGALAGLARFQAPTLRYRLLH